TLGGVPMTRQKARRRVAALGCAAAALTSVLGLGSIVTQLASSASAASANCSASTAGETQLNESGFSATAPTPSTSSGAQNAITNAVNHTNPNRFTSGAAQAVGDDYIVNMASAQTFNEVEMTAPDYSG